MGSESHSYRWGQHLADEVLPGTTYRHDDREPDGKQLFSVRFRITRQCNRNCSFCFIPFQSPAAQDSDVASAIESAVRLGARKVVLSGGEPTLHGDLPELIRAARAAGAEWVELQTNAIRLADLDACQRLSAAGLTSVSVSLPSHHDETLQSITGVPGSLPGILRALENLADLDLPTSITHVLCPQNAREVPQFVRFLAERFAFQKFSFLFAAPFVPELARPELILRFSDGVGPLQEALDYCLAQKIPFEGLSERCGLPECLLRGDARYYGQAQPIVAANRDPQFIDAPACGPCQRRDYCYRVRELYAYLYGVAELRPVLRPGVLGEAPVPSASPGGLPQWPLEPAATALESGAASDRLVDATQAIAPPPAAAGELVEKIDWLGAKLELTPAQRRRSVELDTALDVGVQARTVDGQEVVVKGWRARYGAGRGPTVGALEVCPTLDGSTCRGAAIFRGLRAAAFGLPFGGAHGGLACDPGRLGGEGLADAIAQLVQQLGDELEGEADCFSPHHSVGADIVQRSMESLSRDDGGPVRRLRGWPVNQLGGRGHMPAVSSAVAAALFTLTRYRKPRVRAMRYGLWGFGRAARRISLLLESRSRGSVLIGCADSQSGCLASAGLDAVALRASKSSDGRLPDVARTESADVLGADVDVMFLCARGAPLDGSVAGSIMAPVVVDMTAMVSSEAEQTILDRGSVFVPSAVATSGSMIALAEELEQGRRVVPAGTVERRIAARIGEVLPRMLAAGERFGLIMSDAAMALGLLALAGREPP